LPDRGDGKRFSAALATLEYAFERLEAADSEKSEKFAQFHNRQLTFEFP